MASPRSTNIKLTLVVIATAIVLGTLWYSKLLVDELLQKERDVAALYAKSLEYVANLPDDTFSNPSDYSFIFNEVIRSIDFPMILTDSLNRPLPPFAQSARNIEPSPDPD